MNLQVLIMAVVSKTDISRKIPNYFKFVKPGYFMLFCQPHHVTFDWLKSHTPFPGPNA